MPPKVAEVAAKRTRLSPEVRQSQVLDAAREVFVRSGLAGATVKDIAAAAGVTDSAVYHHFASKEEIFHKAIDDRLHQLVVDVRDRMRELTDRVGQDRVKLLGSANEIFLQAMVEIAPLLAVTLFSEPRRSRELYITSIWPRLNEAIQILIDAGWSVERTDPHLATLGFLGVHYGVVMDAVLSEETLDVPLAAAQITAVFQGSIEPSQNVGVEVDIPRSSGRRRERLSAPQRRRMILSAAREAFLERGLTGTRMKDIAAIVGLTEAGVYAHFESKDELYRAAVQEPLERLVARFTSMTSQRAARHDSDRQALLLQANEHLLSCMVELTPLLAVALFSELEKGRQFYRDVFLPSLERAILTMVREVYGAEAPSEKDLGVVVDAMLGVHFGVALDNLMRGREVDIPETAARLAGMIVLPSS